MKKIIEKLKQHKSLYIIPLLIIINMISSFLLIYGILKLNSIENFLRYSLCGILILLFIYLFLTSIKIITKGKKSIIIIFSIIIAIICSIELVSYIGIRKVYKSIDNMNKTSTIYSSSLISMSDKNISNIENINNLKIGTINDPSNIEGYIIPNEIINEFKLDEKNQILQYDTYIILLEELYSGNLDLIFLPKEYPLIINSIFEENNIYSNIQEETKIIYNKSSSIEKETKTEFNKDKPFSLLIIGLDSEEESITNSAYNSDVLMLITFNPSTYNTTMLSIPRDTYTKISCLNNYESKINHSSWYGDKCIIDTVEQLTSINIDQYIKINFKGLVKIVDALGGIYVDVPYSLCEQDSNREWGEKTIYIEKGYQLLNGEQALALSRNRKNNWGLCPVKYTYGTRNDFVRNKNQQDVIMAILEKLKDINNLNTIYNLLDLIEDNVDTSLTINQILSFYNLAKKIIVNNTIKNTLSIEQLNLTGYTIDLYNNRTKTYSNVFIHYKGSIKDISEAVKINLDIVQPEMIKTFNFSINDQYKKQQIGSATYNELKIKTLERLTGKTETYIKNYAKTNNIALTIQYEDVDDIEKNNIAIKQSIPYAYRISEINIPLIITIGKYN